MNPAHLAAWPLRMGNRARARRRVPLPHPTISVGNLAFGGRAKTPVVAALAKHLMAQGRRPAILTRGYRSGVKATDPPVVLRIDATEPPWASPQRCGDEPTWLAATTGVPVVIHPDRARAAAAIDADLFVLDDGLQVPVERDVDLVLLHGADDPPFGERAALRVDPAALDTADLVAVLEPTGPLPSGWLPLRRVFDSLVSLDGQRIDPSGLGPVTIAAGVGDPASVGRVARDAGLTISRVVPLRDHHAPNRRQRDALRDATVLVTEKDAVGWAAADPPGRQVIVLRQRIEGVDALARAVEAQLG